MTTPSTAPRQGLTAGHLSRAVPWYVLIGSFAASFALFALLSAASGSPLSWAGALVVGVIVYLVAIYAISRTVEGRRQGLNRLMTGFVSLAFAIAMLPLVSLIVTVLVDGLARFDAEFFSSSMRGVLGEGGGALHAMVGTLLITIAASVISIPLGLMTSIYLVEYAGKGRMGKVITFLVDVMTGIPSIVAGLFAFAIFAIFFGPGVRMGIMGAVALSVLMIPVVVRSSEEMLRLVPNELREASYALGVPKWLTIMKIVLPTSIAGITTGIMLAIARVIGETAPLLLTVGTIASMNYNLFNGRMETLPVFVYRQFAQGGDEFLNRAWAAALVLVIIVMGLNLLARLIVRWFAPKAGR